ncbi:glycosyltransferase family 2 protein [Glaciibacter psychrotolerans]|uniref:Glycosyltransferase involved in cell wall biosynthesis n=1 Tax=Glaciibacter psychrotolerans TaxID=670054 RepID=A0A7Z0J6S5_9MICO|nr:glycosyltransferase family 2 protein [Leifsonia psychrotolerans]NYJ20239.1 glycosyltransferase involved in cell wall biosynthesis [Leifsonia psychrotolerans]
MQNPVPTSQVSVALCTFNGARFIAAQLRSILAQSARIAEIVVADDGSADATVDIVRAIAAEIRSQGDSVDIRILEGPGGNGVTKNFERAVAACTQDLIALSDQDDLWHADRLAVQLAEFDSRSDLTLLFGDARLVDEHGAPLGSSLFETLEFDETTRAAVHQGHAFDVLLRRNVVTGATVLFRRSLLKRALPFPTEWIHDEWLAVIAAATNGVDLIDREVIDYRQHGNNEIGVREPSLANKVKRVLMPRGDRNRLLAVRSRVLQQRFEELQLDDDLVQAARGKAAFERFRAELPGARIRRLLPVLKRATTGDYTRFASQGSTDVLRDLLQPA